MRKCKILFLAPAGISICMVDEHILKEHYLLKTVDYSWIKKRSLLIFPIKALIGTLWCDLTFSWFASFHAFFAVIFSKIFRKKSIVVVGGYEVAKLSEAGYGLLLHPVISQMVKFVLKHADKVLTVDDSLKINIINHAGLSGTNVKTIPTGYDEQVWKHSKKKKEDLVITVANVTSQSRIKVKGLETFIRAAEYLPAVRFMLIGSGDGRSMNWLKSKAPANIEFPGFIPNKELPEWYSRAKVYCQLSQYEGLPNALCEAMLCECIPIVTKIGGMPVAMGDTGFSVPYGDVKATVVAIIKSLNYHGARGARQRIRKMFPLKKRKDELAQEINELFRAGGNAKGQSIS